MLFQRVGEKCLPSDGGGTSGQAKGESGGASSYPGQRVGPVQGPGHTRAPSLASPSLWGVSGALHPRDSFPRLLSLTREHISLKDHSQNISFRQTFCISTAELKMISFEVIKKDHSFSPSP